MLLIVIVQLVLMMTMNQSVQIVLTNVLAVILIPIVTYVKNTESMPQVAIVKMDTSN